MPTLRRSENKLIERNLFYNNGTTPLLISSLSLLKVEILQYGRVLSTLSLKDDDNDDFVGDDEIVETDDAQITFEIKTTLCLNFREGPVYCRLYMEMVDTDFDEGEFKTIDVFEIFRVITTGASDPVGTTLTGNLTSQFESGAPPVEGWILTTGVWDDSEFWDDSQVWND